MKAVVDAYDGTVDLYNWDENDPNLKTWSKVFPGVVKPKSEFPPNIFAARAVPGRCVQDPAHDVQSLSRDRPGGVLQRAGLLERSDRSHQLPREPVAAAVYYLQLQMPGQSVPFWFSLTTTFAPVNRQTFLAAFMSVDSDPGRTMANSRCCSYPKLDDSRPVQIQNTFDSNPEIATQINLFAQDGNAGSARQPVVPAGRRRESVRRAVVREGGTNGYPLLQKDPRRVWRQDCDA